MSSNKLSDYSYFLSTHASRRRPLLTRELTKSQYNAPKEVISLAEGMPNDQTFPIQSINILLKDGTNCTLKGPELYAALQYIPTQGYPPLVKTLKEFTQKVHKVPNWEDRDILVTNGSQDGISKTIEMCIEEGDAVLVQNPLYAGTEIIMKPFKPTLIPIDQDQHGMLPHKMEAALKDWKEKCELSGGVLRMPKMLYVNPTGSNPTGTTMTLERRKAVYKICCDYNILILEDDAYCFLHFAQKKPPSFLELDTEGRVIRFDSLSKVISPGLRVAWVTGPKPLLQNVELHIQSAGLHSSTLSQVIVENLFKSWGFEKLLTHLDSVADFYKSRRDTTIASMERYLKGLAEWSVPSGGMFVWIKVKGVSDVYEMLMTRGIKKNIIFIPGHAFMADPTEACNYIRASYSKICPKQIDKAMKLLGELIREEQILLRRKLDSLEII